MQVLHQEHMDQRAQIKEALQAVLELNNPALIGPQLQPLSSGALALQTGADGQLLLGVQPTSPALCWSPTECPVTAPVLCTLYAL